MYFPHLHLFPLLLAAEPPHSFMETAVPLPFLPRASGVGPGCARAWGGREGRAELLAAARGSRAWAAAALGRLSSLLCSADENALGSPRGEAARGSPRWFSPLQAQTVVFPTPILASPARSCLCRERLGLLAESVLPRAGVSGGGAFRSHLRARRCQGPDACVVCGRRPACGSPRVDAT